MIIKLAVLCVIIASAICDDSIDISIVNTDNGKALLVTKGDEPILTGRIGVGRNFKAEFHEFSKTKITKADLPHREIYKDVVLTFDLDEKGVTLTWETSNITEVLEDCFDLNITQINWFGGPQRYKQVWPLQNMIINGSEPYVIKRSDNFAVAERYWLNSKGAYLFIHDTAPLFVDQNLKSNGQVCFTAKAEGPYIGRKRVYMKYQIGYKNDVKQAHLHAVKTFLGKPKDHPDRKMITQPIWTTWPKYKEAINDTAVVEFAEAIKKHGYGGQIEIDADWETCYGSHQFKQDRFRDVVNTVKQVKALGFRVTLWIHPFVNNKCENFSTIGKQKGYFVTNEQGDPKATWWYSDDAHQIDFTKAEAAKWFSDRVEALQKIPGVDSFKFDAGETDYAIPFSKFDNVDPELVPNILTQKYVQTCSAFGKLVEVRSAWRTQELPIFLRMIDKESGWGENNGLLTLITTLLQLNMNGYGMILPDMIGGNAYTQKPTPELIVRWTQANTFMPAMQFGFLPWDYNTSTFDTVKIVDKFIKLHEQYSDKIIQAMEASIENGTPVNPPIWWIDPKDIVAYSINDEFLLGEDILVAPVIQEQARTRSVYLPRGSWKDGNTGSLYQGPITINEYPADIDVLPFFILQK